MKYPDLLEEIVLGVSANKVRSGLTMLGIVIGIASVIALLGVGQGTKSQIEASIQSIGSNLLLVFPGAQRGAGGAASAGRGSAQTLTQADAEAIAALPGVAAVEPEVTRREQLVVQGKNTNTQVLGTTSAYPIVRNVAIELGSFVSDAQHASRAKVIVLGPTVRNDLFGEGANPVGERVRVNGMEFTVIGVTASKGGSGFSNQDDMTFIPLGTLQTFLAGGESVNTIGVQAADQGAMADVQQAITDLLLERHKITNPAAADFSVLNQTDLVSTATSVTNTFTLLLASIAGISLLVGGIGIMNMMLTTVTERTREIGLRLAIGAERPEIIGQFLGEAILLTLLGGIAGIVLGYGIARGVSTFMNIPATVSWSSILLAGGVSALIGLVFGYYPARRAARLNPIEALRYE